MFTSFFTKIICGLLMLLLKINLTVSQCNHGDVRLIGGTGDYEGNVQLCKNDTWGYVCHYNWGTNDAKVLCRQLGFSATSAYYRRGSYYGYGIGTVWLEGLLCNGNENRLIECPTGIDSSCNNAYSAIAGVFCSSGKNCTNGTVRLAVALNNIMSYSRSEGEVQVCYNNQWGSICGNGWSATAATVVCKQLGYTSYIIDSHINYNFNNGLPTWFDSVSCSSSSTSFFNCQKEISTSICSNSNKIGVRCSATDSSSCVSDTVKLWSAYDSTPDNEGIPLVCISGNWYPIYDTSPCYSLNLACKAAGYASGVEDYRRNAGRYYGYYYKTYYRFTCLSSSTNLFKCGKNSYIYSNVWKHSYGVKCFTKRIGNSSCSSESNFRLVDGASSNEGRIEYCYNSRWTPMCSINSYTANIICKELGYRPENILIFSNNEFNKSDSMTGDNDFRYIQCSSTSINSSQCTVEENSICISSTCYTHYGLRCYEPANECVNGGVRLVDGNIEQEGRVEVCVDGIWGQICSNYGWDINDAYVTCVSLGYTGNANPTHHQYSAEFGIGYGPIVWNNVNCYHWNNDIHDCIKENVYPNNCDNRYIAGVRCTEGCSDGDVRLVGGSSIHEGTVEICYDELWGLISDNEWSDSNAVVVCRQLGFNGEGVRSIAASFYGKPRKTIHLKEVNCSSHENSLLACNNTRLSVDDGIALMSSTDVTGVNCQPSPSAVHSCLSMFESCSSNGSVRFVGNGSKNEGLVEYCVGGALWTQLCNIDNKAATVICRQLGYTSYSWGSIILNKDDKPYSLLQGISCSGEESNLIECNNNSTRLSTVSNGCIECSEHSIGLRCFNSIITNSCDEGLVRLVDGPSDSEGRVEVCVNGVWGNVCDNGWDSTDGFIVCQQLGYTREEPSIYSNSYFGDGSYPIVYSNVNCKGWEDSISDCDKDGYLSYTCYPGHTAGLKCNGEYVNAEVTGNSKPANNSGGSSDVIIDNSAAGSDVITDDSTGSNHVIIDNSGGSSDVIIGVISSLFMIVIVIFSGALLALFFVMRKKRSRQPTVPAPYSSPVATTHNKDIQMKPCPVYEEMGKLPYDNCHYTNH